MIFTTPEALANFVDPWAKLYSHSKIVPTIVTFLHVAPIVVGGGIAIASDRATLRMRHDESGASARQLGELSSVHPWVIGALALSLLSGLAMLAADLDTFLGSWVFWVKMGLIGVLLVNGLVMTRTEARLRGAADGTSAEKHWQRMRVASITSITLWLVITFAGVALVNVA